MASTHQPDVLLLSFGRPNRTEIEAGFMDLHLNLTLGQFATLKRASSASSLPSAIEYFNFNYPSAVLITDEAMAHEPEQYKDLLGKIKGYLYTGGRVVFCQDFAARARQDAFSSFFVGEFFVHWKQGINCLADYTLNTQCMLSPPATATLTPQTVSLQAVTITDAQPWECVYEPPPAPGNLPNYIPYTPVAVRQYGQGLIIYYGHMSPHPVSRGDEILRALCGF